MGTWSDKQKFWAETARTIVLGVIGAIAAIIILKPAENRVQYQAELDKTKLAIMAQVVDNFLATSYRYTSVAYDACRGDKNAIEIFQGEGFDGFQSAKNRLTVYFGDGNPLRRELELVDKNAGQLGKLCPGNSTKDQWESVRLTLKKANNDLSEAALKLVNLRK